MNQSKVTGSHDVVKVPATLDKIPEDIQLAIIKFIQSWKRSEGSEQEREKGKRARDSALRAVALSCRKLLDVYRPELLSSVTVNNKSIVRFYLSLVRNPESGKWVRSITFAHRDVDQLTQPEVDQVHEDVPAMLKAFRTQWISVGKEVSMTSVMEGVYQFLPNIQTLVFHQPEYNIAFQSKHRLAPLPFLTHSLKKLFIPMWSDLNHDLKARNVVWLLVFCTGLRSASLGCIFDQNDFKYLAEFSDTFSGLSQVQKLSLGVNFTVGKSIQRYWDAGVGKQWIGASDVLSSQGHKEPPVFGDQLYNLVGSAKSSSEF